jgi:hypothetical protein
MGRHVLALRAGFFMTVENVPFVVSVAGSSVAVKWRIDDASKHGVEGAEAKSIMRREYECHSNVDYRRKQCDQTLPWKCPWIAPRIALQKVEMLSGARMLFVRAEIVPKAGDCG